MLVYSTSWQPFSQHNCCHGKLYDKNVFCFFFFLFIFANLSIKLCFPFQDVLLDTIWFIFAMYIEHFTEPLVEWVEWGLFWSWFMITCWIVMLLWFEWGWTDVCPQTVTSCFLESSTSVCVCLMWLKNLFSHPWRYS